jgi:hypothetical protein
MGPQSGHASRSITAQAMRAVLFASATATTSGGRHTGDLFFIYKSGHLMKLMCQKREG